MKQRALTFHEPALARSPAFRRQDVRPAKAGTPCQQPPFMAQMRDARIVEALHEPQRSAGVSPAPAAKRPKRDAPSALGRRDACPTLSPHRFPVLRRGSATVKVHRELEPWPAPHAVAEVGARRVQDKGFQVSVSIRVHPWFKDFISLPPCSN